VSSKDSGSASPPLGRSIIAAWVLIGTAAVGVFYLLCLISGSDTILGLIGLLTMVIFFSLAWWLKAPPIGATFVSALAGYILLGILLAEFSYY
jgi:hypothetical protein